MDSAENYQKECDKILREMIVEACTPLFKVHFLPRSFLKLRIPFFFLSFENTPSTPYAYYIHEQRFKAPTTSSLITY